MAGFVARSLKSIGPRLRAKRIAPLVDMMESAYKEFGSVNVIDIGGTERYWDAVPIKYLDKYEVHITIVNIPDSSMPNDYGRYKFIVADGCNLSGVDDGSFHIAHSNSVIEHVGDWQRMVSFAKELSRVAPRYFVQTPNYWFPVEPHCMMLFFHWLPKPIRLWLVLHFKLGHFRKANTTDEAVRIIESSRLLTKKMFRELFPESNIVIERFFLLPKSLIAIKK